MSKAPRSLYCPACGERIDTDEIIDPKEMELVKNSGFIAAAKLFCRCGIVGMICVKKMPESPTWTITFDKYRLGRGDTATIPSRRRGG